MEERTAAREKERGQKEKSQEKKAVQRSARREQGEKVAAGQPRDGACMFTIYKRNHQTTRKQKLQTARTARNFLFAGCRNIA